MMKTKLMPTLALSLATLVAALPAHADFDRGVAAYKQKDYATMLAEFHMSANQGDAWSQYALGLINEEGQGAPQNYSEAVNWLRKAAEQEHAQAQNNLGMMYEYGTGVTNNSVIAYALYNLAAVSGQELTRNNRTRVTKQLSSQQLAEAQSLSSAWQVGKPLPTKTATWPAR